MRISTICFCPFIFTLTIPPPAEASTFTELTCRCRSSCNCRNFESICWSALTSISFIPLAPVALRRSCRRSAAVSNAPSDRVQTWPAIPAAPNPRLLPAADSYWLQVEPTRASRDPVRCSKCHEAFPKSRAAPAFRRKIFSPPENKVLVPRPQLPMWWHVPAVRREIFVVFALRPLFATLVRPKSPRTAIRFQPLRLQPRHFRYPHSLLRARPG